MTDFIKLRVGRIEYKQAEVPIHIAPDGVETIIDLISPTPVSAERAERAYLERALRRALGGNAVGGLGSLSPDQIIAYANTLKEDMGQDD